ncbi:MAG: HAMP domain-containing histidine kinase [Endomicrobium sp.]|jgi:signal transduction histidine kinase|nr:HAMP domain-containing histidine kinase [Endomicrobium sp.]
MNTLKTAKEFDDLKDEFLSNVSHDLKIPLSAIKGYCDLLICEVETDKNFSKKNQLKGLNVIRESTARLAYFIDNILDLTKLKSGILKIKLTPVYLDEVVHEAAKLFKTTAADQKKKMILEVHENLPSVRADFDRIKQVILNLLDNAFKFTKRGDRISIFVRLSPLYGDKYVEICVADTGIGISEENIKMIFENFYRVRDNECKKSKGSGLGLSIAYEIIRLHDGKIWAEGKIGRGTKVNFILPILKM